MKTLIERMPAWRDKFWVIPAVAVAVAVVAAEGMLALDRNFDLAFSRLYDGSAESAQGLLAAGAHGTQREQRVGKSRPIRRHSCKRSQWY